MTRSSFDPSNLPIVSLSSFFCSKESTSSSEIGRFVFFLRLTGGLLAVFGGGFDVEATGCGTCRSFFFSFFFWSSLFRLSSVKVRVMSFICASISAIMPVNEDVVRKPKGSFHGLHTSVSIILTVFFLLVLFIALLLSEGREVPPLLFKEALELGARSVDGSALRVKGHAVADHKLEVVVEGVRCGIIAVVELLAHS